MMSSSRSFRTRSSPLIPGSWTSMIMLSKSAKLDEVRREFCGVKRLRAIAHGTREIGQGSAQRFVIVDDCDKRAFHRVWPPKWRTIIRTQIADGAFTELEPPSGQQVRVAPRKLLLGRDVVELIGLIDEKQALGVGDALSDVVLFALLEKVRPDGQRHIGIAPLSIHDHALDHDAEVVGAVAVQRAHVLRRHA